MKHKCINGIFAAILFTLTTASFGSVLNNGWSVVACEPRSDNVTLAVKDITQFGTLWNTPANRGNTIDHSASMPAGMKWETSDFGGQPVYSMAIDPRDGTIYTITTRLYDNGTPGDATIYKIDKDTGVVSRLVSLPGNTGGSYLDIDVAHDQIFAIDMDSGTIHRVSLLTGVLLSSYDPFSPDDGAIGFPQLGERLLGVAYNAIENRVYYSVWALDGGNTNQITSANVVRSIGLNGSGDFNFTDDVLEITPPPNTNFSMPVGDIEFNDNGTSVLLAEVGFISAGVSITASAHQAYVSEWSGNTGSWNQVGSNPYYGVGWPQGGGHNASGGVAWAYSTVIAADEVRGADDFILVTANAISFGTPLSAPYIYGYQFIPRTSLPRTVNNSIAADLDNNTTDQDDKVRYADVDIYLVNSDVLDPCCPPINKNIIMEQMTGISEPNGGIDAPYRLNFSATSSFNSQMQSYLNYVATINPSIDSLVTTWDIYDIYPVPFGTLLPNPLPTGVGTIIESFNTTWNRSTSPTHGNTSSVYSMVTNYLYRVDTRTYFNNEPSPFSCPLEDNGDLGPVVLSTQAKAKACITKEVKFFPQRCELNSFWVNVGFSRRLDGSREFQIIFDDKPVDLSTGAVSEELDIYVPSLNYQTPDGILNLWADFEYYEQNSEGELLWKLKEYGDNNLNK